MEPVVLFYDHVGDIIHGFTFSSKSGAVFGHQNKPKDQLFCGNLIHS